jgi:hypothetical protein
MVIFIHYSGVLNIKITTEYQNILKLQEFFRESEKYNFNCYIVTLYGLMSFFIH